MIKNKKIYIISFILVLVSILLYLTFWMFKQKELIEPLYNDPSLRPVFYGILKDIISERVVKVFAIIMSAILISITSLVFQTLTKNRILTPSILGFDSIYSLTQTTVIFLFGGLVVFINNPIINFTVSTIVMVLVVGLMYLSVFKKNKNNIVLLLLVGMVISSLARSAVNFMQVLMDPNDFQSVQALTSVSITNINVKLVFWVTPLLVLLMTYFVKNHRVYDTMQLGESEAINLGVDYHKKSNESIILITIAMAVSTALIGPLSFLGLIAVNSAKEILKKYQHLPIMILSSLIAVIFLVLGQVIIEMINYTTTVTTLISLVGGIYMIYLILKESK